MNKKYYGIADCHGIESFMCEQDFAQQVMLNKLKGIDCSYNEGEILKQNVSQLFLRAGANHQRRPVVYEAELSKTTAKHIKNLLLKEKYAEALQYLKENSISIHLAKNNMGINSEKNWKIIPNPDLDPFA